MKRILLSLLAILLTIMLIGCGGTTPSTPTPEVTAPSEQPPPTPELTPEPTPEPEPKPAEFILSNLQVEIGKTGAGGLMASVDVQNVGGLEGIYELKSKVDEEIRDILEVELSPGEKKTIDLIKAATRIGYLRLMYERGEVGIGEIHIVSVGDLSKTIVFPEPKPEYMLQCLSWSNYTEYGYIHVVGEVKNISNAKLENVMAVVSFRTEDGTLVKTDDALIDYDVLMPGQTSSFEVLTTENPAIKKLGLSFKQLFGSQIPTKFD